MNTKAFSLLKHDIEIKYIFDTYRISQILLILLVSVFNNFHRLQKKFKRKKKPTNKKS